MPPEPNLLLQLMTILNLLMLYITYFTIGTYFCFEKIYIFLSRKVKKKKEQLSKFILFINSFTIIIMYL